MDQGNGARGMAVTTTFLYMKTAEAQPATAQAQKTTQPFFDKAGGALLSKNASAGQGGFFSSRQNNLFNNATLQTKLTVGQPNDKYEQEADAMADKVVQRKIYEPASLPKITMPAFEHIQPLTLQKCVACGHQENLQMKEDGQEIPFINSMLQKKPIFESKAMPPGDDENIQRKCAACEQEDDTKVQPKINNGTGTASAAPIENTLTSSKGKGSAMPAAARLQMEASFGTDFSGVRLHTDSAAVQMNKNLNAQAFTHGNDIYFNAGKYGTNDAGSKHLLAHELTHVVQQRGQNQIQRFTEAEHKSIVDDAIAAVRGNNLVELVPGYTVTAGDITAMTGDHFKSKQQIIDFLNNPDREGPESKEEVEYVRWVDIRDDKTKKEAYDKKAETNDKTKKAIENANKRYYALAGQNKSHFPYPNKGDELLPISELAEQWANSNDINDLPNAIAGYRRYHIQALLEAYQEGFMSQAIGQSITTDSSSYHFLTDSFSAGHVQAPRASLQEHWHSRVPMFNNNLKGFISNQVAEYINNNLDKYLLTGSAAFLALGVAMGGAGFLVGSIALSSISLLLTENFIYDKVLPIVTAKIDSTGILNFGDVVSGALHDYFNTYGIVAKINNKETTIYGDSHLDSTPAKGQNDTRYYAAEAVKLSYFELEAARQMGIKKQSMPDILTLKKDGLFAAETMIPKPAGKVLDKTGNVDKPIEWEYDKVKDLLADIKFQTALQLFAKEKSATFKEVIAGLKLEGVMKPLKPLVESAFKEKVIGPLEGNSVEVITEVINWTPDTGGGLFGHDEDDKAMEYVNKTKKAGNLGSLTLEQKARLIKHIMGGVLSIVFEDEEQAIVDLFQTTAASERKKLYAMIEGHPWGGDFKEGWLTWDDELYNSLSGSRLDKVRNLINEK